MNLQRAVRIWVAVAVLGTMPAFAKGDKAEEASADERALQVFREAGQSSDYFRSAYGYAVFPSIGKGGIGVGAAHGKGRVYEKGKLIGDVTVNQVSFGAQLGGQSYSEIIFFQNPKALRDFTSGNFEFGAGVSAVAITAGAGMKAGTGGSGAGASATKHHAATAGGYQKGMAVFTVAKGGLMYEASLSGQKFKFKPLE